MPNDPVLTDQHLVQEAGLHDIVVLEHHESQAQADGSAAFDPWEEFDAWRAKRVMHVLQQQYPGHLWCVVSDRHHGIVKISIPVLMGIGNWFVINEKTHDVTPGMVIVAGGEILERYKLKRGRFQLGQFLEARDKHSALVSPWKPVPE